jgi:F-type H+-transporting ATPase subunit epsilon
MRLTVVTPTALVLDTEVTKVIAPGADGSFCLLPRHRDAAAALAPGILTYRQTDGAPAFLGIDEGVLVKRADTVHVAVVRAVAGAELGALQRSIERESRNADERARSARTAAARLEAGVARRLIELGRSDHGRAS